MSWTTQETQGFIKKNTVMFFEGGWFLSKLLDGRYQIFHRHVKDVIYPTTRIMGEGHTHKSGTLVCFWCDDEVPKEVTFYWELMKL